MSGQSFELIPGRYGLDFTRTAEHSLSARMPLWPSLVAADGSLCMAALLMAIDMACGVVAGLASLPSWTVTADIATHIIDACRVGPLRVDAECLRAGRSMAVAQATLVDEGAGDRLVALATANHGVLTPDFEPFLARLEIGEKFAFPQPRRPKGESLEEYFGLRASSSAQAETTEARVALCDRTQNPWGIFHGGLHGLLIDSVARSAGMTAPRDVFARFINPVRDGDAVAQLVARHERGGDQLLRIEVTDSGSQRVAAVAHVAGAIGRAS